MSCYPESAGGLQQLQGNKMRLAPALRHNSDFAREKQTQEQCKPLMARLYKRNVFCFHILGRNEITMTPILQNRPSHMGLAEPPDDTKS